MARTYKEEIRVKKLIPFAKLSVSQKVQLDNIKRNPNLDATYQRRLRGLVMKGLSVKKSQELLRIEKSTGMKYKYRKDKEGNMKLILRK